MIIRRTRCSSYTGLDRRGCPIASRGATAQGAYNRQLQEQFEATRRVAPPIPADAGPPGHDTLAELKDLAQLHESGALDDEEFAAAKAKLLGDAGRAG